MNQPASEQLQRTQNSHKRSRTFRCGGCGEPISSVTWTHDHVSEKTGAWIHEARRSWVHDWNGSINALDGHSAWRAVQS